MTQQQLPLFPDPDSISAIQPDRLRRLLRTYACELPEGAPSDLDSLTRVLMTLDGDPPADLVNAVHIIHDLSHWDDMDALLAAVPYSEKQWIDDTTTPADVATEFWLRCPRIVERVHAQRLTQRMRACRYYCTRPDANTTPRRPSEEHLQALKTLLDSTFVSHGRGGNVRIVEFQREQDWWYVIWHGEAVKRDRRWHRGAVDEVQYRPAAYDVVSYHPNYGELRITARTAWQQQLHRAAFGMFLFGSEDYFPGATQFTLEPLRQDPRAVVNCVDIPGVDKVVLHRVDVLTSEVDDERRICQSNNLLLRGELHIPQGRLMRAVFHLKLRGHGARRVLDIRPSNVAYYKRDSHGLHVEHWLRARNIQIRELAHDCDAA
jgi:hypothetical protein